METSGRILKEQVKGLWDRIRICRQQIEQAKQTMKEKAAEIQECQDLITKLERK